MKRLAIAGLVLVTFALPLAGQQQIKYGVKVTVDKSTDFKKFKTYVWQSGWDASDKKAHMLVVTSIDREMKALGLERKASAPADLVVKYAALRRIDIDPALQVASTENIPRKQLDVGSLLILMLEPGTGKELFRGRLDKPIEIEPEKMEATVNGAVGEIFAQHPLRTGRK